MDVQRVITGILLVLGAGFLVANAQLLLEYVRFRKRRGSALLTWRGPQPPYYGMALAIGVVLGVVVAFVIFHEPGKLVRCTAAVMITAGLVIIGLWGN